MQNRTPRTKSHALPPPVMVRMRLLGWPAILIFTLLIVAVMVLLYPRDRLIELVVRDGEENLLSHSYLNNLLKDEPANGRLGLRHAQRLIAAGRHADAEWAIAELARRDESTLRIPLALTLVELRERQAFSHPPGSAARSRAMLALHTALHRLAMLPLSDRDRMRLATKATAYGASELSFRLYRDLARHAAPAQRIEWLDKAARSALSLGRYREAAAQYFEIRQSAIEPDAQKRYFLAGVRTLQAGNLVAEALAQGETYLGNLADDRDTLVFMVRLAQAANRNDRAEFYVRKLLRFLAGQAGAIQPALAGTQPVSAVDVKYLYQEKANGHGIPFIASDARDLSLSLPACTGAMHRGKCWLRLAGVSPIPANPALRRVTQSPQLPFDEEIYSLGYTVFLANRKLAEAYAVAAAAVRQAPDSAIWRERLAQVSEWSGKPAEALEHWRWLALNRDSEPAWQALLRLAPGLFDEEATILALEREYRKGRLDEARLLRLVQAYENTGEPDKGIDFLNSAYRRSARRQYLEQRAWLEERMGTTGRAISTLRLIERNHGLRPDEARRLAALLIMQGGLPDAYRVLREHDTVAARRDPAYQRLLAELAWLTQDRNRALRTYQSLRTQNRLQPYEADRLIELLRDGDSNAAANLAASFWQDTRDVRYLMRALDLYNQSRNVPAARRLLSELGDDTRETLAKQPGFLKLRAEIHRNEARLDLAIEDLKRVIELDANDIATRARLLWLLVEARDRVQIQALLPNYQSLALQEPILWEPMGAAYVLLERPRDALPYFARSAAAHRDDYLWQTSYAQVLEDAGHADMAWRLRRHAWLKLRSNGLPAAGQPDRWQAAVQLALRLAPGDASAQWLREWMRQDGSPHSAEARELATAWFLSHEQYESARLWLLQQYGRQLQAPGWAEAAIALQRNDKAKLAEIAAGQGENIATETRVEAAMQLREYALARKLAMEGLALKPDSDLLHQQLTQSLWQQGNHFGGGIRSEQLGALRRKGWRAQAQWSPVPHLRLGARFSDERLESTDAGRLIQLPKHDRRLRVSGSLLQALGETSLALDAREALDTVAGLELAHQLRLDRRLGLRASLGYNQPADENDALSAGAARDEIKFNLEWLVSKREYLLADLHVARYVGQDRKQIGSGHGLTLQLGHRLRTEYPDLSIKLIGSLYRFNEEASHHSRAYSLLPPGSSLLPDDFRQLGLGLAVGETVIEQFSRSLRPYAAIDVLHNSSSGWGYDLEFGFVFSPTGQDWLRGRFRKGQSTFGSNQDSSLLDLEYRYLF